MYSTWKGVESTDTNTLVTQVRYLLREVKLTKFCISTANENFDTRTAKQFHTKYIMMRNRISRSQEAVERRNSEKVMEVSHG
jgi:hypothetical protein